MKDIKLRRYDWMMLWLSVSLIICMFGVSCNFAAVMDNGERMPVYTNLYVMNTETHFSFVNPQEINHPFLADRFDIGKNIYSIGDFLIFLGVLSFMTNASLYLRWKFQRKL